MSEPLDFKVIEAHVMRSHGPLADDPESRAYAVALLAHARALRAALRDGLEHMHLMTCASMDGYESSGKPCDCWHSRAAAVLAAAQDGPA